MDKDKPLGLFKSRGYLFFKVDYFNTFNATTASALP